MHKITNLHFLITLFIFSLLSKFANTNCNKCSDCSFLGRCDKCEEGYVMIVVGGAFDPDYCKLCS